MWAPGGWRGKRLAAKPEFPRVQHRARTDQMGAWDAFYINTASISAPHTLPVNFTNTAIGPFPRQ